MKAVDRIIGFARAEYLIVVNWHSWVWERERERGGERENA